MQLDQYCVSLLKEGLFIYYYNSIIIILFIIAFLEWYILNGTLTKCDILYTLDKSQ